MIYGVTTKQFQKCHFLAILFMMSDDEIIVLQHARLMWLYMLTSIAVINTGLENIAMFSNISKIS